tara:strand:+ start:421 stop:669 length:249 start_codon:yes stop_codon:yes gene_type:complete
MTKRNFSITRKQGELYHAKVTDSYGNEYDNYFETADKANDWIYYVWEKEDWFNSANSQELLANAIANCIEIDKENGIEPSLD